MAEFVTKPSKWRGRPVRYEGGTWSDLQATLPTFAMEPFAVGKNYPENPHLRSIVRQPMRDDELPIPVGVVSPAYALVQHHELGSLIVDSLRRLDLFYDRLRCEVGMTPLGEWMTLRFYMGDDYSLTPPDGHPLDLRIETVNSVDGSGKLLLLMSWFRLICSNGLVVRDTLTQLADVHDSRLKLGRLDEVIVEGLKLADADRKRLEEWARSRVNDAKLATWADGALAKTWGKKAAARCLHICRTGFDAHFADPFEGGKPSERNLKSTVAVPGAASPVRNAYDAAQALSWVATSRPNVDERLAWQTDIPQLIRALSPKAG